VNIDPKLADLSAGLCYDSPNPDIWYPMARNTHTSATDWLIPRSICLGCPVIDLCLESALDEESRYGAMRWGMRGGKTPEQRRRIHVNRLNRASRAVRREAVAS
jgi:hypothetical protein